MKELICYEKIPVGQAEDLTNQRFGNYTVLFRVKDPRPGAFWLCKCDCGVEKIVRAMHLKKGSITSCGCLNREKARQRMKDYNNAQRTIQIGDVFGKLTVVEYEGLRKQKSREKNESWYICQCDCGSEPKAFRGNDLTSGNVRSCGCLKSLGELTIEEILKKNNIKYKTEFSFEDLKNPLTQRKLRFDFAIFDDNEHLQFLIEFDGRQHFSNPEAAWKNASSLEDIQNKDQLKNEYCKENNITLKRIKFYEISKITYENIFSDKFNI